MGRRKNGQGLIRQRKDGRWEGRCVVGYDEKNLPITKNVLAKTKREVEEMPSVPRLRCILPHALSMSRNACGMRITAGHTNRRNTRHGFVPRTGLSTERNLTAGRARMRKGLKQKQEPRSKRKCDNRSDMLKQNNQRKGTTVDEGKRKLFYRGQPDLYIRVEATRYCGLLLYLPSYKPQNRCSISVTADDSKGMWYREGRYRG